MLRLLIEDRNLACLFGKLCLKFWPFAKLRIELKLPKLGKSLHGSHLGLSENEGALFWGPYNRDPTV